MTQNDSHIDAPTRKLHKQLLASLPVGRSFFIEGVQTAQLAYLRRLGYGLNITLSVRQVLVDEIYGRAGVRVKRMT